MTVHELLLSKEKLQTECEEILVAGYLRSPADAIVSPVLPSDFSSKTLAQIFRILKNPDLSAPLPAYTDEASDWSLYFKSFGAEVSNAVMEKLQNIALSKITNLSFYEPLHKKLSAEIRFLQSIDSAQMENLEDVREISNALKDAVLGFEEKNYTSVPYRLENYTADLLTPSSSFESELLPSVRYSGGAVSFIGARTSHGKTAFLMNEAVRMVQKTGQKCAFITLEESRAAIASKMACVWLNAKNENKITLKDYLQHFGQYENELQMMFDRILIFDSPVGIESLSILLSALKRGGVELVFLDYIQRLNFEDMKMRRLTRQEQIKAINSILLGSVKDLGITLISGAQFNRTVDTEEKIQSTTVYREAGDIEQDANLLINLWNHRFSDGYDTLTAYIAKNRNGRAGMDFELESDFKHWLIQPGTSRKGPNHGF